MVRGSTLDSLLEEDGTLEEAERVARERVKYHLEVDCPAGPPCPDSDAE